MNVSFEEIGRLSASFRHAGGQEKQVCKLSAADTVNACADGDRFCGVIETVRGNLAGVQLHGFAEVSYTGAAPAIGYANLQANGQGGVKAAGSQSYLVVSVNTAAKTAVIEL